MIKNKNQDLIHKEFYLLTKLETNHKTNYLLYITLFSIYKIFICVYLINLI